MLCALVATKLLEQRFAGKFAGCIARQRLHQNERSRQKCGVHPLAQFPHDDLEWHSRGDDECHQTGGAIGSCIPLEEDTVFYAVDAQELMIEIRQRGALACDVDEIGWSAAEKECISVALFDHIVQQDRPLHRRTAGPGPTLVLAEPDAIEAAPWQLLRGPPG